MQWLRQNPAVLGLLAAVILGAAGFLAFRTLAPAKAPISNWRSVWCYDLSAGKIIIGSEQNAPPFAITGAKPLADGSPPGVRAEVFSCGSCDVEAERFAGWLWKFTPDVAGNLQEAINSMPNGYREDSPYDLAVVRANPAATLIASPEKSGEWIPEPLADKIKNISGRCKGTKPKPCPVPAK